MESNNTILELMIRDSTFYNELLLPHFLHNGIPHFLQSWLRNCVCGIMVFALGCLININFWRLYKASSKGSVVSVREMISSSGESLTLLPWGSLFITGTEYMSEKGWTQCYPRLSSVGLPVYLIQLFGYLLIVEVLTYVIHRWMHEVKPVYKYIHRPHHTFSKESSLSPFAGWALHPVDGMLMQIPQLVACVTLPTHYTTHLVLCLVEAMWGIMVHSRSNGLPWPFMDAKFHNIHHTSGRNNNYGNFTIWMDHWFKTLRQPDDSRKVK